jgi:hypothetical protein
MAEKYTLELEAGATYNALSVRYLEDDKTTPVPLTALRMQIRETPEAALALEVVPTWDSVTGLVEFEIPAEDTASLALTNYVWALEVDTDEGQTVRLVEGKVIVSPEVVR